jgi:putative Mg2+ transporter-C (MgtC) family protein
MHTSLAWPEIALRLTLTIIGGALIGFDRGEHGRPAGLRTTLLVCLAASIAMIQANLLMETAGKAPNSFVVLDLMRLPLGILSGMGFIGAGAIIRRDSLVLGVTTAATLWFVTIVGLCFGGGQIGLGIAAVALGLIVLWGLKLVEQHTKRDVRAGLTVVTGASASTESEILTCLTREKIKVVSCAVSYADVNNGRRRKLDYELEWRELPTRRRQPEFLEQLAHNPAVVELNWAPGR